MLGLARKLDESIYIANREFRIDVILINSYGIELSICGSSWHFDFNKTVDISPELKIRVTDNYRSKKQIFIWIEAPKSVSIARGEVAKFDKLGNLIRPKK